MKRLLPAALACIAASPALAAAGTPGPAVSLGKSKGLEYFKGTYRQVVTQTAQPVACTDGEVTGGGGSIAGPASTSALHESYPSDGTAWRVEASSTSDARTLTGWAICDPDGGIAHNSSQSSLASNGAVLAGFATCGESGQPIGGGGEATGLGVRLIASTPSLPPSTSGWRPVVTNPTPDDTIFTSWAICANPQGVRYRESDVSKLAAGDSGKAVARCKDSEAVLGGGFEAVKGDISGFQMLPTTLKPVDSGDDKKVPDDGWQVKALNDETSRVGLVAIAVCRKPL